MKPSCFLVGTMTWVVNYKASEQFDWANNQVHDEHEFEHIEDAKSHNEVLRFCDAIWYFTTSLMSHQLVYHRCNVLANDSGANNEISSPIVTQVFLVLLVEPLLETGDLILQFDISFWALHQLLAIRRRILLIRLSVAIFFYYSNNASELPRCFPVLEAYMPNYCPSAHIVQNDNHSLYSIVKSNLIFFPLFETD